MILIAYFIKVFLIDLFSFFSSILKTYLIKMYYLYSEVQFKAISDSR